MNRVFILCEIRHIEIPCAESVSFIKECNQQGVHPSGGTVTNGQVHYTLPNPVSKEEAIVIFKKKGHGGEIDLIEKLGAFKALVHLNLLQSVYRDFQEISLLKTEQAAVPEYKTATFPYLN